MPLNIIKIHNPDKRFDPLFINEHRTVVLEAEDLYPGITAWYDRKAKPGLEKGERIGYLAVQDGVPVGAAIAKQGENAKICTVRVREESIHEGIGKILFLALAMNLRHNTKQVHFTAPDQLWTHYTNFFHEMGFTKQGVVKKKYRQTDLWGEEIAALADYRQFRRSVFNLYLPIYGNQLTQISGEKVDVILSVKPDFAQKIVERSKTIELRRKFSKRWIGSWALIYSTMPVQAFTAAAQIVNILKDQPISIWNERRDCLGCNESEFFSYTKGAEEVYCIVFGDVKTFDPIPKSQLEHLLQHSLTPPQSYCEIANNPNWGSAVGLSHMLQNNI